MATVLKFKPKKLVKTSKKRKKAILEWLSLFTAILFADIAVELIIWIFNKIL